MFNGQQLTLLCALIGWAVYCFDRALEAARGGRELRGPNTALLELAGEGLVALGNGHLTLELAASVPVAGSFITLAIIGCYALGD